MKANPRIAFLGTGAQGASIAADFALAGLDVTFIDQWPAHVEAMRKDGLRVHMPTRTIHTPVKALHLCEVAEIKVPFDLVFLVVKAYDTRWACELIKPVLAPDGVIVGLQNDHDESWFALGALDPAMQPQVEVVADILRHSGRVEVNDDIRSAKWMKLIVNAAELIPSAIIDTALNDAARLPGMLDLMRKAGYEAMEAALADGATIMPIIGMPPVMSNHPERYVDEIFEEVLKTFSREDTLTTSLQDWRKGRRAEVEEVHGWVVDTLATHGKSAPVNKRVVEIALEIEAGDLPLTNDNLSLLLQSV